jgi:uncharacterized delta-60 repeat protein
MPPFLRDFCILAVLLFLLVPKVVMRGQSVADGFDPKANGTVRVVVVQPDGKILIGGDFTSLSPNFGTAVSRNRIARLNPSGLLDTLFSPGADSSVNAIAVQADGKILLGGSFTSVAGQPRNRLARLNPDGTLDVAFDPNANDSVSSIVVQADGRILVGGRFNGPNSIGGQPRNFIARLDPITGLADSFDPNANTLVSSIVVQSDGKVLVNGAFTSIGGQLRNYIARLDAATGLADQFDPNANSAVESIAVQADGRIVVGGGFTSIGGQPRKYIARLDATTGVADSFNPDADGMVRSIAIQADGKILAGGAFTSIGGQPRNYLARLDATSALADSFNPSANSAVLSITVQADRKILAGGDFTTFTPNGGAAVTRNRVARIEIDGRLDQTLEDLVGFNGGHMFAIATQADGKILIGGSFSSILGVTRHNIARLNTDGTLDAAFDPNANDRIWSIVVQPEGKILVGGEFTSIGGQLRNSIARLDATTGLADSFDPNAVGPFPQIESIVVQMDGKLVVCGGFETIGGQSRKGIARIDPTTGLPDSFDPHARSSSIALAVQTDGKILVGGAFFGVNSIGGQTRNYLARLDPVTALADSFDPSPNELVSSIALQPDGRILVAGWFNDFDGGTIGGQPRNHIARLDATTGLADSFNPSVSNVVESIGIQADGKVVVVGQFTSAGGMMRTAIARLDGTSGAPDSFAPNSNDIVFSLAIQADGKLLVSGDFSFIGGSGRSVFGRLTNDTGAFQNLVVTQNTITWTRGGSSPQLARVTFEYSTDNVNYTSLGDGTPSGDAWTLTGLNLPTGQNFYIRARGYYRTGINNGSESITESVRNAFLSAPVTPTPTPTPTATPTATPASLGNISTRLRVETGDNVLIGGFIITGNMSKKVVLRGIGPSLGGFGLSDPLADPTLELRGTSGALIFQNDDWQDNADQAAQLNALGLAPPDQKESGIVATLTPSAYTAVLAGKNNGAGIGLVEIYDTSQGTGSQLANISTRGFVRTGNNVMIGGFILGGGSNETRVVVRGIGPSLAQFGLSPVLTDPTLELRNADGALLLSNDDWQDDSASAAQLVSRNLAPQHPKESGIFALLPPGAFTAILAGKSGGTGIGLVEIYNVN